MSENELRNRIARLEAVVREMQTREQIATVKPWTPISGGVVYVDPSGTGALTTEAAFIYDDTNNELVVGRARLTEQSTPSTPVNPYSIIFANSTGVPSGVNDAGNVYEMLRHSENSWTPTLVGSGTAGTFTYDATNTKIQYERIGNKVYFNGRLITTATSVAPVGNMTITGLPIAAGANSNNGNILGGVVFGYTGFNLAAGYTQMHGFITGGSTTILLYEMGDNVARAIVQGGEVGAAVDLFIAGWYKID